MGNSKGSVWFGPILIGAAALMWATDALFRLPAISQIDAPVIVSIEHFIGVMFLSFWLPFSPGARKGLATPLPLRAWLAALLIGAGGSSVATILFTASFRYINPSVTILLQKLQPVLVVLIALLFLGERPKKGFLRWAVLAIASGVWLSFPDLNFDFITDPSNSSARSIGVIYALTAATLWAVTTVAGKALLRSAPVFVATYWRYVFGLAASLGLVLASGGQLPVETLSQPAIMGTLFYMGLIPGLTAMILYYQGLRRTPANVTTFVELIFPVSAVLLNAAVLHLPLTAVQIAAAVILLFAVTRITAIQREG